MEIYEETTFGGGLEWDDDIYIGKPEHNIWDVKLIKISLEEQELFELAEMNETMNRYGISCRSKERISCVSNEEEIEKLPAR